MQVLEIPLSGRAERFGITLGGLALTLTLAWRNTGGAGWVLDLADTVSGLPMVRGIPLVTGLDLLEQHRHLGIPGGLFCLTDGDPLAVPTYANMGTASHLFWSDLRP